MEVDSWLRRKFEGALKEVEIVHREDLDLKNHLSGIQRKLLKLTFWNQEHLMQVDVVALPCWPAVHLHACLPACLPPVLPCAVSSAASSLPHAGCCQTLTHRPLPHPVPCLLQVRREIQPIVSRNRYRRDGTSAYQLLAEQQRPTNAKAGKERLQVGVGGFWACTGAAPSPGAGAAGMPQARHAVSGIAAILVCSASQVLAFSCLAAAETGAVVAAAPATTTASTAAAATK